LQEIKNTNSLGLVIPVYWDSHSRIYKQLRVNVGASCRVHLKQIGLELVILLAGDNKSTQDKDIKTALVIAKALKR
jgi:putative addiction module killer protein